MLSKQFKYLLKKKQRSSEKYHISERRKELPEYISHEAERV